MSERKKNKSKETQDKLPATKGTSTSTVTEVEPREGRERDRPGNSGHRSPLQNLYGKQTFSFGPSSDDVDKNNVSSPNMPMPFNPYMMPVMPPMGPMPYYPHPGQWMQPHGDFDDQSSSDSDEDSDYYAMPTLERVTSDDKHKDATVDNEDDPLASMKLRYSEPVGPALQDAYLKDLTNTV